LGGVSKSTIWRRAAAIDKTAKRSRIITTITPKQFWLWGTLIGVV
jgi:hypothetical protein